MDEIEKVEYCAAIRYITMANEKGTEVTECYANRLLVDAEIDRIIDKLTFWGGRIYKICYREEYTFTK